MKQTLRLVVKAKTSASTGPARPLQRLAQNGIGLLSHDIRLKLYLLPNKTCRVPLPVAQSRCHLCTVAVVEPAQRNNVQQAGEQTTEYHQSCVYLQLRPSVAGTLTRKGSREHVPYARQMRAASET